MNNKSNYYAFLPMLLACSKENINLSPRALILYSLMLSRKDLSKRNLRKYRDSNGIFIYFSQEEMSKYLKCSLPTTALALKELISANLVIKENCKNGKSPKYYVKDLIIKNAKEIPQKEVSFDIALAKQNEDKNDFGTKKRKKKGNHEKATLF